MAEAHSGICGTHQADEMADSQAFVLLANFFFLADCMEYAKGCQACQNTRMDRSRISYTSESHSQALAISGMGHGFDWEDFDPFFKFKKRSLFPALVLLYFLRLLRSWSKSFLISCFGT